MSEGSKLPEWSVGFKRTELVIGEKNTMGAVSNIYVEESLGEMVMKETIIATEPKELMAMKFMMDFMEMD